MVTNIHDLIQDEHDDVSGAKRILMYGLTTASEAIPVLLDNNGLFGYLKLDGSNANTNINIGAYNFTATDITATNIFVDHIAEKTGGHGVVIDNSIYLGGNVMWYNTITSVQEVGDTLYFYNVQVGAGTTPSINFYVNNKFVEFKSDVDAGTWWFAPPNEGVGPQIVDLGTVTQEWKDLYLSGDANIGGEINAGATTITSTTEPQFKIAYDATKYINFSVDNVGATTIDTGGPSININKSVAVIGDIAGTGDITRTGGMVLTTDADNITHSLNAHQYIITDARDTTASPIWNTKRSRGTLESPSHLLSGDNVGRFYFRAWTSGTGYATYSAIKVIATENHYYISDFDKGFGMKMEFYTVPNGGQAATLAMGIDQDQMVKCYKGAKIGDGGTTHYTEIKADGEINLHGTARVKKSLWLPFEVLKAPGTKPADYVDHGIAGAWSFSDGTDDTVVFLAEVPPDMDRSVSPTLKIGWSTNTTATNETAVWQFEYLWMAPGEDTTAAAQDSLTVNSNAIAQANGLIIAEITGIDAPDATDVCVHCRLKRLGADGDDDLTDTAEVHGVCLSYTANKLGEAT